MRYKIRTVPGRNSDFQKFANDHLVGMWAVENCFADQSQIVINMHKKCIANVTVTQNCEVVFNELCDQTWRALADFMLLCPVKCEGMLLFEMAGKCFPLYSV